MTMAGKRPPALPQGTVRNRLATICEECGYTSVAALGEMLGESRSNMNQWQQRDTYGQSGAVRLSDLTGADLNWLFARSNEPFPNGAKINPTLNVQSVYAAITENRRVVIALAKAIYETAPGTAMAWARNLEGSSSGSFFGHLLDVFGKLDSDRGGRSVPSAPMPPPRKQK
jgi:hypothetical protein